MAFRIAASQSAHDEAVRAAGEIYRDRGRHVWLNPDGEKNKEWGGFFADVIAAATPGSDPTWVVEVETEDSVSASEAKSQWAKYGDAYPSWCLAVPISQEETARRLIREHGVEHCTVILWEKAPTGSHTFWGLPGLTG